MCSSAFMSHDREPLRRHRPRWQCGTCGRVSSVPLDCCPRPDVTRHPLAGLIHLLRAWVSRCGRWTLASVRLVWGWQRLPAIRAGTTHVPANPQNMVTADGIISTADGDESPEGDKVGVAAGERR
jgi:hypothetical protein